MRFDFIPDIKKWMCFVPHAPLPVTWSNRIAYIEKFLKLPPPFELPDGTAIQPSASLCTIAENIYFPDTITTDSSYRSVFSADNRNKIMRLGSENAISVNDISQQEMIMDYVRSWSDDTTISSSSPNSYQPPWNADTDSIASLIYASIATCDADVRKELLANIVLVGGVSLVSGMRERLLYELQKIVPSHMKVYLSYFVLLTFCTLRYFASLLCNTQVKSVPSTSPVEQHHAAWIGGSVLSICGSFQQLWVARKDYDEQGAYRVIEKHFVH